MKTNLDNEANFIDTCRVRIQFYNTDFLVYEEVWTNTESIEEWTNVILPLNQIEPILTDCKIIIEASYPGIGLGSGSINTWISVDDFQFEFTDSISTIETPKEFNIYPNPSNNGSFKISSNDHLGEIIIYDLIGNIVEKTVVNSSQFHAELELSAGIYFIKVLDQTRRVVVR